MVLSVVLSESKTLRDSDNYYKYAEYTISRSFVIDVLTDGVYYVKVTESWNRTSYNGYDDPSQIPYPASFNDYSYYIIK